MTGETRPLFPRWQRMGGTRALPDRAATMRRTATGLLVAMAGIYVLAGQYLGLHPSIGYVRAFAEAAMVGGLADWFAVTALFRRPLGLPIPHTAIIPENKDRIADTMAQFLQDNFLTPAVVARRMQDMNLAKAAGEYLAAPAKGDTGERIRAGAGELIAEFLESLDPERLGSQMRSGLKTIAARVEIAPLAGQLLTAAIADKRHLPLIDSAIRWAGLTIEANEDMIRAMIHEKANGLVRWTGLDEKLANSVLDGLYKLLAEVLVDPEHPLRGKLEEGLAQLAHDLLHDPEMQARVEKAKNDLLDNPVVGRWWLGVWERIRGGLLKTAREPGGGLSAAFADTIADLGTALQGDPRLQVQINRFARRTAVGVATRYGGQIVRLVSETVKRWDAHTVTDRIESAVGRDLQFIRMNGTLVGGLVGVTIHAVEAAL
ncbi:hypothetical protein A6F68_00640 [Tsuneonella dongtanensis]|uniref:DUF445 domain-containing protein n=2 Tax=Tsuneonella dongtanensis TaxID=692370 RepID=A0A1B2AAP0_9SPHN|nr:hypothetical protein A6F68_00640 [Tsuneonella dongtanensis]